MSAVIVSKNELKKNWKKSRLVISNELGLTIQVDKISRDIGSVSVIPHEKTEKLNLRANAILKKWKLKSLTFGDVSELLEDVRDSEAQVKNINLLKRLIDEGKEIYVGNKAYKAYKDNIGQYLISSLSSDFCIGMHGRGEDRLNFQFEKFTMKCKDCNRLYPVESYEINNGFCYHCLLEI